MKRTLLPMLGFCLTLTSPGFAEAAVQVEQVIVVFKTHFDIGYTDMASNVVTKYRTTMIDQALKVVDQNRDLPPDQQFAWTIPGWPMKKITEDWPGQTPERKQRVMQAFRDGRFVVHALPFTTHTELLEAEDLVRGMSFSSRLARDAGLPLPRDAKMTDVPSHSWFLPTMLRHAGVDFLHLGCNAASSSPQVPRLFWWEGPDGSRLLTMYTAESYGTGLEPPKDWPYKTWLALIHTGDNHGPPTPDEAKKLLDQAKQKLPGVKVRIGRLSDFADAILAEKADLPVVRGDMPDTWIHGPMSDPRGARMARNIRPVIATTELMNTTLRAWGVKTPDIRNSIATAYEQSLLYGEHTWGGAFWWIYGKYTLPFGDAWQADRKAGTFARIESSWDEHTSYIVSAWRLMQRSPTDEVRALAKSVGTASVRVVVFNPLPWRRDGVAEFDLAGYWKSLKDATTGEPVALAPLPNVAACFVAKGVPPGGYRTYILPTGTNNHAYPSLSGPAGEAIENEFFRIAFDVEHGVISSWRDKRTDRELVDAHAPQGFGQYLYERFDRDNVQGFVKAYVKISADWGINELGKPSMPPASEVPYRAASPTNFNLKISTNSVSTTATLSAPAVAGLVAGVTTTVTLYRGLPFLDLGLTIHDKPFDPWPEAGWLCLPFKVDDAQFRLTRLGSIVDPSKDFVAGCNFDQIALNGGLTVTDRAGAGVGLCALDSPVVSLGEPGGWKYTKTWSPRPGRVFVNLFNNQWTTNFRLWNSGTWTSRVRLWPVSGGDLEQNLTTPSAEARFPLVAALANGPAGDLPVSQAGVELSRRGVQLTAFGPNPDGSGTLLRLWELAGQSGAVTVKLPSGLKATAVRPVDLRGQPDGQPISVSNQQFSVPLRAFAPFSGVLQE